MQYIVLDTETGGFDPSVHSLLSVALIKTTANFQELKELHIKIKYPVVHVSPEAMEVNKLDLRATSSWLKPDQARSAILKFLDVPEDIETNTNAYAAYTLCGMNVQFDVGFMKKFLGEKTFTNIFYHRVEEIMSNFRDLQKTGAVRSPKGYKLFQLLEALDLKFDSEAMHDALYDAKMAVKAAREMQRRNALLADALKSYVTKHGGDLDNVLECYRHGDVKARMKKLRHKGGSSD